MSRTLLILAAGAAVFAGAAFVRQAGHSLDLGAGRGHNEVLYPRALPLRSISFNATLSEDSYLIALFNRDSRGFSGVRFSRSPLVESAYFEASPAGRFRRKEAIPFKPRASEREVRLRIDFDDSGIKILQDGVLLGTVAASLKQAQGFGFRNGERPVQVDSVGIELKDGTSLQWSGQRSAWSTLSGEPRDAHRPRYFPGLHLGKVEALAQEHFRDLSSQGKGLRDPRREPSKDRYRILFVGGSQTLGEGVEQAEDRWTERFLRSLRKRFSHGGLRIESELLASHDATAQALLAPLEARLSREQFDVIVVDLSCLDYERLPFLRALENMATLARNRGAEALFILEPTSIEVDDQRLRANHRIMLSVAEGRGIPVLDLHYRLSTRDQYDSGILWRDYFNLSAFGQEMLSEALTGYFLDLLR